MVGKYENKNQDIRKKWFCILNVGFLIENEKKKFRKMKYRLLIENMKKEENSFRKIEYWTLD